MGDEQQYGHHWTNLLQDSKEVLHPEHPPEDWRNIPTNYYQETYDVEKHCRPVRKPPSLFSRFISFLIGSAKKS